MNIDQTARRAASAAGACYAKWIARSGPKIDECADEMTSIIAAEFAPLQAECDKWQMAYEEASERAASIGKRLAEAERLLGLAQALIPGGSSSSLWIRFDKFLAAKENGNG